MKKIALTAVALASLGLVACEARTNENGSTTVTTTGNVAEMTSDVSNAASSAADTAGNYLDKAGDAVSNGAAVVSNEVSESSSNVASATRNEVRDETRDAEVAANRTTR